MAYSVYAMASTVRRYIYVGLTNNMQRRFAEHQRGWNAVTKPYRPFIILHEEACSTRPEAREREKWLKSGVGKEWLHSKLQQ